MKSSPVARTREQQSPHDGSSAVAGAVRSLPAAAQSQRDAVRHVDAHAGQRHRADAPIQRKDEEPRDSGLPDPLRTGIEALSGVSMAGVQVHHNSDQPGRMHARAFTRSSEIHLAPGQERHLPHEAWHVVQQRQGRVAPTRRLPSNVPLNDDIGLEREADVMGARALSTTAAATPAAAPPQTAPVTQCYDDQSIPGYRMSQNHQFAVSTDDNKQLLSYKLVVSQANVELRRLGALIQLQCDQQFTENLWTVVPTINPRAVKSAVWQRMTDNQPGAVEGAPTPFRAFADCMRTGTSVAGIDPGARNEPPMMLDLPSGVVNVMTVAQGREYGAPSLAARVAASFFLDALPKFQVTLAGLAQPLTVTQQAIVTKLGTFTRLNGAPKIVAAHNAYKAILADAEQKAAFVQQFGINGAAAPSIGTTLTQYNDPEEKQASLLVDKWNFHWAGVVLVDGSDYVTLENCAVELEDATTAEMTENNDIYNDNQDRTLRGVKNQKYTKQDMLNDRWYFKAYGAGAQSFHDDMMANDTHVTPSAITLPVHKR
jgi:hypothetical protein